MTVRILHFPVLLLSAVVLVGLRHSLVLLEALVAVVAHKVLREGRVQQDKVKMAAMVLQAVAAVAVAQTLLVAAHLEMFVVLVVVD